MKEFYLKKVVESLNEFKDYIDFFNLSLMEFYNLNNHPYLNLDKIPRSGIIKKENAIFSYKFHGGGCEFIFNDMVLDYQITPISDKDNIDVKISIWKFRQFLNTTEGDLKLLSTKEIFFYFEKLVEKGVLSYVKESKGLFSVMVV